MAKVTRHTATGNPAILDATAEFACSTAEQVSMTAVEASILSLVHILALELGAALERISKLEDSHG